MLEKKMSANTLAWIGVGVVAVSMLGGALVWSQIPRVYATNGFDQNLLLRVDGEDFLLPPQDWVELDGVSSGTEQAEFSLDRGQSWSTIPVDLSIGARAAVINPHGAAWVFTEGVVYSASGNKDNNPPVVYCGEPFVRISKAEYRFEEVDAEIKIDSKRSYAIRELLHMDGGALECVYTLLQDGNADLALPLAELTLDPDSEASVSQLDALMANSLRPEAYRDWVEQAHQTHGTLHFEVLLRLAQLEGPEADATQAELMAAHVADPVDPRAAYLYALTLDGEEAIAVMAPASQANPEYFPLNRRLASTYEDLGDLERSIAHLQHTYEEPEFGDFGRYWAAQNLMRTGRVPEALETLEPVTERHWDSARTYAHLTGGLPKSANRIWGKGDGEALRWILVYAGKPVWGDADNTMRLAGLVMNGSDEDLRTEVLGRKPGLVRSLEDHELLLLHIRAEKLGLKAVLQATEKVLAERPAVAAGLEAPFEAPVTEFSELSVAVACIHQVWSGELTAEQIEEMVDTVGYYDPFGMVSAPAGWATEPSPESEPAAAPE